MAEKWVESPGRGRGGVGGGETYLCRCVQACASNHSCFSCCPINVDIECVINNDDGEDDQD